MTKKNGSETLLVSFCNVFPGDLALGLLEYNKQNLSWLHLDKSMESIKGVTEITSDGDNYYCLVQLENKSGLCVLDKNLNQKHFYSLIDTNDAHSIMSYHDGFLVTDTSKNRINFISILNGKLKEKPFWKYGEEITDQYHINSIARVNDKIYASMFGKKSHKGWAFSKSGKIIEISNDEIICDNLNHPHSLTTIDGSLYCLESGSSKILKFSNNTKKMVLKLQGYLRGITFDKNNFYVAASAIRKKSRSTGTTNVLQSSNEDDFHSWIYKIDRISLLFEKIDLTSFGAEIFDLAIK